MEVANSVEYKIRDLVTRAVVFGPTQAQVTRDIKAVPLKPGVNEISVLGLTPTVDEHSIKVEGSGAATITSIAVESVPNQEIFEDVHPESESDEDEDDDDDDASDELPEQPGLMAAKLTLFHLNAELSRAKEAIANADDRIKILDTYCKSLEKKETAVDISQVLGTYKEEREKAFEERAVGAREEHEVLLKMGTAAKEHDRLQRLDEKLKKKETKARNRVQKAKAKQRSIKLLREERRAQEKDRTRKELEKLWPKYCYTIRIQLEVTTSVTPASSRRGSVSSETEPVPHVPPRTMDVDESQTCDLVLSYVTGSAYWSPTYDLQLSATTLTGTLCFDGRLTNMTSEKWENCKVTLSATQVNFSGPDDVVPTLKPWHIKLCTKQQTSPGVADSLEERAARDRFTNVKALGLSKNRSQMFGADAKATQDYQMQLMLLEQQNKKRLMMARQENDSPQNNLVPPPSQGMPPSEQQMRQHLEQRKAQAQQQQQMQMQAMQQQQQIQQIQQIQQMQGPFQMQQQPPTLNPQQMQNSSMDSSNPLSGGGDVLNDFDFDTFLHGGQQQQQPLEFQESFVDDSGFSPTYDLPGFKTVAPKLTASKLRIASIPLRNVFFSHTVVAKYQPVAHLKAKMKNTSKWTILRGPVGVTLDGAFIESGRMFRCNPGESFTLGLGVDPAVKVTYPRPDVRKSTTGVFGNVESSTYARSVTVHNTRAASNKPINLFVMDQIPVSKDDKLRVGLVVPDKLAVGEKVAAGAPSRSVQDREWGTATASLKKSGEVTWEVKLNPSKAVKLPLEYQLLMPSGESAREC